MKMMMTMTMTMKKTIKFIPQQQRSTLGKCRDGCNGDKMFIIHI